MLDVLVVGAGPAGSIAAWRLARAGVRVMLVDRDRFPRHKLCGDTLNPGAVALLRSLPLVDSPVDSALALSGMLVTGPHARVEARYGGDVVGRAIERRVLDQWLLSQAIAAGAAFEDGITVRGAVVDSSKAVTEVCGARVKVRDGTKREISVAARMTLAADGRSSVVARSLGLAAHPSAPRRWAFGTYVSGVAGTSDLGEMHIRGGKYIGVAPIADDLCNVCVVTGPHPPGRTPLDVVRKQLEADPALRDRFARARFESRVSVLGPLAFTANACGASGLLLAGDAAGFVDPMTGDGLHLAIRGGLLAAEETLAALASGDRSLAVARLESARGTAIGRKLRFNRALRRLVEVPAAVTAAGFAARFAPSAVRWAVRYAGDAA
jgi:geranylgeranyl reductase family protein